MTNQIMSFYIPRMRTFWTQDQISTLLFHSAGVVDRVDYGDYAPANQMDTCYAFVHFSEICQGNRQWIDNEIYYNGYCKIQIAFDEFWMLIPNRNPIPTTHLNIHQLADTITKQTDRISTLESMVYYLQAQLEARAPENRIFVTNTNNSQDDFRINFSTEDLSYVSEDDDYADMPELISISTSPETFDGTSVNV